jgi:phage terminase large subunit
MKATRVYDETASATTPFIVNEGGSRSSKTYSVCQHFINTAHHLQDEDVVFAVVRKTMPALRASAMRDYFDILKQYDLYEEQNHDQSNNTYRIGNTLTEFFSVDQPDKVRGRKRKYLWMNEANELSPEDFFQLNIRTEGQIYLDYNPSDMVHWIYTEITHNALGQPRPTCTLIKSTYKDNPFIAPELVEKIEALQDQDLEHWMVYGLGERAKSHKVVYDNWDTVKSLPEGVPFFGLDFGYNEPSALIEIQIKDQELWERELLYETKLTNSQLIERIRYLIPDWRMAHIYADSAEPARIEEMKQAGFSNVRGAEKGKDSVRRSIDLVKRFKCHILESSVNLVKEKQAYKWKTDKAGNLLQEPVDFNDHLMAGERYAVASFLDVPTFQILFEA